MGGGRQTRESIHLHLPQAINSRLCAHQHQATTGNIITSPSTDKKKRKKQTKKYSTGLPWAFQPPTSFDISQCLSIFVFFLHTHSVLPPFVFDCLWYINFCLEDPFPFCSLYLFHHSNSYHSVSKKGRHWCNSVRHHISSSTGVCVCFPQNENKQIACYKPLIALWWSVLVPSSRLMTSTLAK